jgi:hypothetical protein
MKMILSMKEILSRLCRFQIIGKTPSPETEGTGEGAGRFPSSPI